MKKPARSCANYRAIHEDECPKRKRGWSSKPKEENGRGVRPWRRKCKRIFERDNYLCQICLSKDFIKPIELNGPSNGVLDRIINKKRGGTDEDYNLQAICQLCYSVKTVAESKISRDLK